MYIDMLLFFLLNIEYGSIRLSQIDKLCHHVPLPTHSANGSRIAADRLGLNDMKGTVPFSHKE